MGAGGKVQKVKGGLGMSWERLGERKVGNLAVGVNSRKQEETLGGSMKGRTRKGSNERRMEVGSILGGSSGDRSCIGRSQ